MARKSAAGSASQIRIIGGQWRGSRLQVLDRKGLRPTPDRIRETLFNWLAGQVSGSRVLDCFAGAGGLGFEAASREAKQVTMIDRDPAIAYNLKKISDRLQAGNVEVIASDIEAYLVSINRRFDLVFIDPPYDLPGLRSRVLSCLIENSLLQPGALLYLEWPVEQEMLLNHDNLIWVKQKKAGRVSYAIAQWDVTG